MKKIKIYILFVLLVAACDKKTEYGKFDEDADFAYGICLDYKRDNDGYYIFQYKRQLKQRNCNIIRKKLVEKSNNERYKNYSYTLKILKFDFKSDKYSLISYIDYDVYDNAIDSFKAPKSLFLETKATHIDYIAAKELVLYDRETNCIDKLLGYTKIFQTPFQIENKANNKSRIKKYVSPGNRIKNAIWNTRRKLPLLVNANMSWMDVQLKGKDLLYVYRIDDSKFNLYEVDYTELEKQIKEGMFVDVQNKLEKELTSCANFRSIKYRIISEWDDSRMIDVVVYNNKILGRSYNSK